MSRGHMEIALASDQFLYQRVAVHYVATEWHVYWTNGIKRNNQKMRISNYFGIGNIIAEITGHDALAHALGP